MAAPENFDAVVIGGGPAGSAIAGLLGRWGHSVLLLTRTAGRGRGLAESLPPSTRKVLAAVGMLEHVDRAGFCRSTGNTVWWGPTDRRVEYFDSSPEALGYQVYRPDFDRLLLDCAAGNGARVRRDVMVQRVRFSSDALAKVDCQPVEGNSQIISCRFALDCSGRAGVIARMGMRRKQPGHQTQALVGVWRRERGWGLPDDTQTLVETYEDGWGWSIPTVRGVRHVGIMVDPDPTHTAHRGLEARYKGELVKVRHLNALVPGAGLERVWACDASLYTAQTYGGSQFLLIGDAATFIDPLSSYGVKKALASAWIGAIVVHTCLVRPAMRDVALDFHSRWEQRVYATHLRRLVKYAHDAAEQHPHPFWTARARTPLEDKDEPDENELRRDPDVLKAYEQLRQSAEIRLRSTTGARLEPRGVIRGHEIVLEPALIASDRTDGLTFLGDVNLPALVQIVGRYRQIPDLFEAYCRMNPPVPLPSLVSALAVLLGKGLLEDAK